MNKITTVLVFCLAGAGWQQNAFAASVAVDARCNIYGAGHPSAPNNAPTVGTHGGGVPPAVVALAPFGNAAALTLQAAGSISFCAACGSFGPDGASFNSASASYHGLSGITNFPGRALTAVFTSDSEPAAPAPSPLDFAVIGPSYAQLAPSLNQVFFIGDGLAGTTPQVIQIPAGATKLYFGLVDGFSYTDTPDGYEDNTGTFTVAVAATHFITSYFNESDWLAANGGASGVTTFSFQGATETGGKYANDPSIVPSYASQGVVFLPFTGTTNYPVIIRGQQYQISAPNHDGLLANSSSPNPVSDLEGRAIKFNFIIPVRSVGVHFNGPLLGGDLGYLEAFDYAGNLIGQTTNSVAGGFVGLVADTEIAQIHIVNTANADINFGIWDLEFKEVPVRLTIRPQAPGAVLSWSATAQNYILQSTNQLAATSWLTVTNASAVVGNELSVPVSANQAQQFYRLQRQP